jgi:hypothetical protein
MCSSCSTETVHRLAIGLAVSSYGTLCEASNDHYQDCQKWKTAKAHVTGVFRNPRVLALPAWSSYLTCCRVIQLTNTRLSTQLLGTMYLSSYDSRWLVDHGSI